MTEPTFSITVYDRTVSHDAFDDAETVYREVYAEQPYLESEEDFANFSSDLPHRARQESFRLVIARLGVESIGFALGHQLPVATHWWNGAITPIPDEVTSEYPGRTFAVIELAVREPYRRRGTGRRLHAHLTIDLPEDRQTLLVRPESEPALAAYASWGYSNIGQIRPFEHAPIYNAMLLVR